MTTIVNTPAAAPSSDSGGLGSLLAVVLLVVLVLGFLLYGLPLLRRATTAPTIHVPDRIDVNVQTPNP